MFFTRERKEEIISAFQSAFDDYIDNPEFDLNTSELNVKQSNKDGMRLELGYYPNMFSVSIDYHEDINIIFMSRITKVVNENSDGGELLVFIHNNIDIPSKDMDYQSYKDAFSFSLDKIIEMKTNENAEIIKAVYSRYYRFFELGLIEDRKNMFGMMMEFHRKYRNKNEQRVITISSEFVSPRLKIKENIINNRFVNVLNFEDEEITPEILEKYANPKNSYINEIIEILTENQYYR